MDRLLGRGTKVYIAHLKKGDTAEPLLTPTAPTTLTVTGTSAITKASTSIPVSVSPTWPSGAVIPAHTYLLFTSATGKEVLVKLTSDFTGGSSVSVEATPADIAASSTAQYPLRLLFRKTASVNREVTTVDVTDFDQAGLKRTIATVLGYGLTLEGDYAPLDPAYATIEYMIQNFLNTYAWLQLPIPSADYQTGRTYKGVFALGNAPLQNPADNLITANVEIKSNGGLVIVDPVPTA